jgi:hypothetical protein
MTSDNSRPRTAAGRALLDAEFPKGDWWPGYEEEKQSELTAILAIEAEAGVRVAEPDTLAALPPEGNGLPLASSEADGLDVERLARALQSLWRMRKGDGISFVWDLPVPPDEQTAKAIAAAYLAAREAE